MSGWHIQDIGTVSAEKSELGGRTSTYVRVRNIGYDLGMTAAEARRLARALTRAADEVDQS